jgi:hypothetical protein
VAHKRFTVSEFHSDREFIWPFDGEVEIRFRLSSSVEVIQFDADDAPRPPAKGRLMGRVVSATGEALPNIPITAHGEGGSTTAHTRTDDNGSYSLALYEDTYRITGGGELVAPSDRRSSPEYTAYARNEQTRARVTAGRRTQADIVLSPVRLFNVTVVVVDDQGQTVPNADIFVVASRENFALKGSFRTGQDGSVRIGPTLPGPTELLVRATKDGRHFTGSASIEIQNRPLRATMTLVPSGIITGRVEFVGRVAPLHGSDGLQVIHNVAGNARLPHNNLDPSGRVSATGDFMVGHLLGDECLWLTNIPSEWRLLDITHDGQDYTRRPFLLESGQTMFRRRHPCRAGHRREHCAAAVLR